MNELEKKAVEDIEHELEVSKQFPYLHKPREVAKQLVLRCGYGKVKEYQEEIDRLKAENINLTASLESAQQDKANLERTIEEMNETLNLNGISIDFDGNVNDGRKLIELVADVGDTIYLPWVYDGNNGVAHLPIIEITKDMRDKEEIFYHTDFETDFAEFAETQNYGTCLHSTFGKHWFTDETQAKIRLEELIKETKR